MKHRPGALLACAIALVISTNGCSAVAASNPVGGSALTDPGCVAALQAVSTYGPRAVDDLAQGREAINRAELHLLVLALDSAADAANKPADKQAIKTLANLYQSYYDLTTTVVAVPAATLLKDTSDLETVCKD